MPRAPSEKVKEAEKLFRKGMSLAEIAKKLEISDGTVRSWKKRYDWDKKTKNSKRNVANDCNGENVALQKKKSGAQPGNQNAKGGRGNPHPSHVIDTRKHGGYSAVYWDTLSEDEKELIEGMPHDEEMLLIEQIQLFAVRERRIMQAINKYREQKGEVTVDDVTRSEEKRTFKDTEEEAEYEKRQQAKISSGDRLPGKPYHIQTHTVNKDRIIVRLEQELSSVQNKKTKSIEALYKYRIELQRLENERGENTEYEDLEDVEGLIYGEESSDI